MVKQGANANEILIPKMDMDGLANYDKAAGYEEGGVTLDYETKKCSYDRGRMFTVDAITLTLQGDLIPRNMSSSELA